MANKFLISLFFLLSFSKGYSQSTKKVVYVYDTVTVYDTIYVYDTIKEGLKSDKIMSIEKALLEIDTASLKSKLTLFNKADTATFFIDSILLSNNLNKKDTMKKNILIALATGIVSFTSQAQNDIKGLITLDSTSQNQYVKSNEKIVFQNIENQNKNFEVNLPMMVTPFANYKFLYQQYGRAYQYPKIYRGIRLKKNRKLEREINSGVITGIYDSVIKIKYYKRKAKIGKESDYVFLNKKRNDKVIGLKKQTQIIMEDKSLPKHVKEKEIMELVFKDADSILIPISEIENFKFSKINSKNKVHYTIVSALSVSVGLASYFILMPISTPIGVSVGVVGVAGTFATLFCSIKKIKTKEWKLVQ